MPTPTIQIQFPPADVCYACNDYAMSGDYYWVADEEDDNILEEVIVCDDCLEEDE